MNSYLRHLVNFAHVVNAGSITAAANREHTSPSTMSESVKIIENFANRPLLERTRTGVVLLGEGRPIYAEALTILEALNRVGENRQSTDLKGEVRVSMPIEFATGWMMQAVAEIQHTLPDIDLVLMAEDTMLDHLKHTRDLYVRVSRSDTSKGMHVLHHTQSDAVMIAAPDLADRFDIHDPTAVARQRLICSPSSDAKTTLPLTGSGPTSLSFTHRLQINDIVTRIAFARQGLGLTCCIATTVHDELTRHALVRVLPETFGPKLNVMLGAPRRKPPQRVVKVAEIIARFIPGP